MNKKFVLSLIAIVIIIGGGFLILKSFAPAPSVTPPSVTVDVKQNVENYLRENIVVLSPVKAVLGGTWYVTSVTTDVGKNSGTVTYEDGHIQEIKNFSYTTNEKGEVISLTIIEPNNPVACTMEAKLCPDGSAVGRSGPNCEFSACPGIQIKEETTASLNQRILNGGIYITPLAVVSDSRCPADVQCIWAGEILIKVKLEKDGVSKEVELKEGGLVSFEGNNISFIGVKPENKTNPPVLEKDYQFTFKVVSINNQGTVSGKVTTSPTCPVERIPPDPNCAPKPYATSINILKAGSTGIIKTIQSDANGAFNVSLDAGSYTLHAGGGKMLPRCPDLLVKVISGQMITADISCDTGIR